MTFDEGRPVEDHDAPGGAGVTAVLMLPGVPAGGSAVSLPPDIVDEWGMQSFPASDPPANW